MPKNKSAFIRYRTIDRCLRNSMHPYPAKEFLRDKCEYELFGEATGDKISVSSIEKDLEAMRNDAALGFFAPIKYHRVRQGYYYAEPGYSIEKFPLKPEEEDALKFASLTLVQYKNIPIFGQFQEAIDKIYAMLSVSKNTPPGRAGQVIHFETAGSSAGASLLQQFFHAISHDLLVEFDYDNIYKNEQKHFCVHPYLLKEVRRKWYVLAWYEKHAVYLTFALDRVKDFRATETFQKKRDDFDPEKIFRYSTGIMGDSGGELVDLLIEVKMPNRDRKSVV